MPSSKPGIMRPWPMNRTKSVALPPSNSSPSTEPTKSIVTRESAFAAALLSTQVACCLRNTSIILSISASVISTVGFSTLMFSKPFNSTSGYTSKVAVNDKSLPGSNVSIAKVGRPAMLIFSAITASKK